MVAELLLRLEIQEDDLAGLVHHHHGVRSCLQQPAVLGPLLFAHLGLGPPRHVPSTAGVVAVGGALSAHTTWLVARSVEGHLVRSSRIRRGVVGTGNPPGVGYRLQILEPRVPNRLGSATVPIIRMHLGPLYAATVLVRGWAARGSWRERPWRTGIRGLSLSLPATSLETWSSTLGVRPRPSSWDSKSCGARRRQHRLWLGRHERASWTSSNAGCIEPNASLSGRRSGPCARARSASRCRPGEGAPA